MDRLCLEESSMDYVPDNLDLFNAYEAEQERQERQKKKMAHYWGTDYEEDEDAENIW